MNFTKIFVFMLVTECLQGIESPQAVFLRAGIIEQPPVPGRMVRQVERRQNVPDLNNQSNGFFLDAYQARSIYLNDRRNARLAHYNRA